MSKKKYDFDVIVIGSGPGGSSAAMECAKEELKVAAIDRLFGGTCALKGCTPKKAMETVTSAWWQAKDFEDCGFPSMDASIDWKELMAHKSKFTALVPHGTKQKFESEGITVIEGEAVFEDKYSLKVGSDSYSAKKIVIATGAKPLPLDFEGAEYMITSADFFELDELPSKIVFVGGGYIGFELSHIVAACGAKVVILSMEENPLGAFDNELTDSLVQTTLKKGIDVRLGFEAQKIEKTEKGFRVKAKRSGSEKTYSFDADLVINSAGRIPAIEKLGVSKIDLSTNEKGGIEVNEHLQTSKHSHIFAIGDVTGKLPFTEIANYEGDIVAHNILNPKDLKSPNYTGTPAVVFTHPKMAAVGKSEAELKEEGIEYEVFSDSFSDSFLQRTHKNDFARYKTIVEKKSRKVLGANVLGYGAEDMINIFAACIQAGITSEQLSNMLLAYPTASRQVKFFF